MKKALLIFVILAVIVVAVIGFLKMKDRGPNAIAVETAAVKPMEIVRTVSATGRIQPKTQVNISADVSAKITRMEIKEGDWVEKGDFLLEIDRETYLAAVDSAQANLAAAIANTNLAKENMIKANKDYERTSELFDRKLESQASLDTAYAQAQVELARHESAGEQAEQARAALKQAQDSLAKTTIYAPMAGTVSKLNKEVGEIALGSQFQEDVIMVISNLAGMEALVDVDENDIVAITVGDQATIEVDALPDLVLEGEVTDIANSAKVSGSGTTDQKTEFEVKIAVTKACEQLRPGMTASADIVTDVRDSALAVPIQSVAVRTLEELRIKPPSAQPESESESAATETEPETEAAAEQRFSPDKDGYVELVFVVKAGICEARQVKTGIQSDTHIEIIEGLAADDEVVIGSYRAISRDLGDGSAVSVAGKDDDNGSEDQ